MKKFYVSEGGTKTEKRDALLKAFRKALSTNLSCLFFSKEVAEILLATSNMWDKEDGREESYYCVIPGTTLTFKKFCKGTYVLTGIKGGNSLPEFDMLSFNPNGEVAFVDLKR